MTSVVGENAPSLLSAINLRIERLFVCCLGTAKLMTKHGKWFLHIAVTKDVSGLDPSAVSNVAGVDLGINFLAVSYDSSGKTTFYPGRKIKQKRAQYKKTRKELQSRKTPSARQRLKKIGQREHRWMQDVNHCVSKARDPCS